MKQFAALVAFPALSLGSGDALPFALRNAEPPVVHFVPPRAVLVADTDINATFAGAGLVVAAELFVVAGDAPLLQP